MYTAKMLKTSLPLLAALLATTTYAQTFTDCNPMNRTDCPLDTALGVGNYSINFVTETMGTSVWNTTNGVVTQGDDGAEFTINKRLESPTVKTNFYLFFGQVEVIMKAATGAGIISSIVLESDDLDEVDWEFMGSNTTHVETNYFGKGNTTSYNRAIYYPVETPQDMFHNYTTDWSSERINWYIDGQLVRTLEYADANGGYNFPQTPMNVRMGIWAGGDPSEPIGVIQWAQGNTTYEDTPYTMVVQSVRVSDASRGTQYKYGDETGSWQSIQILNNTKPISLDGNNSESTLSKVESGWNKLPTTTKIGIGAGAGALVLISAIVFSICCIKQRRGGRREKALDDAAFEKQRSEVMDYRADMSRMRGPGGINPAYMQAVQSLREQEAEQAEQADSPPQSYGFQQAHPQRPEYAPSLGSYRSEQGGGGYPASVRSFGGGGQQGQGQGHMGQGWRQY